LEMARAIAIHARWMGPRRVGMTSPATSSEPPRPLLDRSRRARGSPWPATTRSLPGRRRTSRPGTRSAGPPSGSVELEPISPIFLLGPLGLTVLRRPRAPYWWSLCRHRTPRRRSWTRWRGSARAGGICWRWPSTTRHTAGARPGRGRGGRGVLWNGNVRQLAHRGSLLGPSGAARALPALESIIGV
jgi:hypothetical protein